MSNSRMISKIARNVDLIRNATFRNHDLNKNEFEAMRYISKHPGITSIEISMYLNVDKALVTRIVRKLFSFRYIEIMINEDDKRKKGLYITEEGLSLKMEEFKDEEKLLDECMTGLNAYERNEFFMLLEKVYLKSKELRKSFYGVKR